MSPAAAVRVAQRPGPAAARPAARAQRAPPPAARRRAVPALASEAPTLRRRCACGGSCPLCQDPDALPIQTRLTLGAVDDPLEREADQVATRIMAHAPSSMDVTPPPVRSVPAASAPAARCAANAAAPSGAGKIALDASELASGGVPMSVDVRTFFESRVGRDLSGVRIHTGPAAEARADALAAHAFTLGSHIWLGRGQAPQASWLMAHELAHVLQHTGPGREAAPIRRLPAGCPADPATPPLPGEIYFRREETLNRIRESIFEREPQVLRQGDSGVGVQLLQDLLLNEVCEGIDRAALLAERADFRFGPATREAVRHYQRTHTDALGRALAADGRVGPLTLGAMDASLGLPVIPPAQKPESEGDCFGVAEQGPGEAQRLTPSQVSPFPDFIPNDAVWTLSNFDVAKHFVKTEHRAFLRDNVVPAINALPAADTQVSIVGEASTTASPEFNRKLSDDRALCVAAALMEAGLDPARIVKIVGRGELYAGVRRLLHGTFPLDNVEDRNARMVSIVLAQRVSDECSDTMKLRGSTQWLARVGCESPFTVRVNIGDRSDPARPTYREFRWIHAPWPDGCTYHSGPPPGIPPFFVDFETALAFHLALRRPGSPDAPTEFEGAATHRRSASSWVLSGHANPYQLPLGGVWIPASCDQATHATPGFLVPIGPVQCGAVPAPPQGNCLPVTQDDCPDAYKATAAQHYMGIMIGGSADVSRILPPAWRAFVPLGAAGLLVLFTTTDLPGPQLARVFVYLGAGISGAGSGWDRAAGALAPKKDVGASVQLQTSTGTFGRVLGNSDFRKLLGAKLAFKGASNRIDLETGVGTFPFFGPHCNHGGARDYYGILRPVGSAFCAPKMPEVAIPERSCEEEEDCPESTRLAGHRGIRIRVGRLTTRSLPPGASDLAARYGCELVAAELAVDTDSEDGGPIHREFVLLMQREDCDYLVARDDIQLDLLFKRRLASATPDALDAPSDLVGAAVLNDVGQLTIMPLHTIAISFKLPGGFGAGCTGKRGARGLVLPASVVNCGEAPEPEHDTRAELDHKAYCEAFKKAVAPTVEGDCLDLKAGTYDPIIAPLGAPPRIIAPPAIYEAWLRHHKPGDVVRQAFFVGKALGATVLSSTRVVAYADFRILAVNTDRTMVIQFLTDVCAFDENGKVVALRPRGCADEFARAGDIRRVGTILFGSNPVPPRTQIA